MNVRLVFAVTFSAFLIGACQCGPSKMGSLCEAVLCSSGLECDEATGKCRVIGSDAGSTGGSTGVGGGSSSSGGGTASSGGGSASSGGGTASSGGGSVTGGGSASTCSNDLQCSGNTPWCLLDAGACIQCRTYADCAFNQNCDPTTHSCSAGGTGGGTASTGGGTGSTGGGTGSTGGGTGSTGGGSGSGYCLPRADAGTPCRTECTRGFSCVGGFCQLNGQSGPVQITLRFPRAEDLDLHVREPLPDGGQCEIFFGDKGPVPDAGSVSSCGAIGWLDLDSNAACSIDNVNIENVIYDPALPPPRGRYDVYVDYYQACFTGTTINYEVEVRSNGFTRYYCGSFSALMADQGGRGDGRFITSFVIP